MDKMDKFFRTVFQAIGWSWIFVILAIVVVVGVVGLIYFFVDAVLPDGNIASWDWKEIAVFCSSIIGGAILLK